MTPRETVCNPKFRSVRVSIAVVGGLTLRLSRAQGIGRYYPLVVSFSNVEYLIFCHKLQQK